MANAGFRKGPGSGPRPGGARFTAGAGAHSGPLFSPAQIHHLMKTEFARARRYGFPVACIVAQTDRMASLTDIHGVEFRDLVRSEMARVVREKTRAADQSGWSGDDRLLVVLPHTTHEQAMAVAERIRGLFAEVVVEGLGARVPLTLSMGVAACEDESMLFFDTILSQAEAALQQAQEAGGNRVAGFRGGSGTGSGGPGGGVR